MRTFTEVFELDSLNADPKADAKIEKITDGMAMGILAAVNAGKRARVTWTMTVEAIDKAKPATGGES